MTTGLCLLRTLVHRWPLEPKTVHAKALNFIKIINVYMNLYKNIDYLKRERVRECNCFYLDHV